MIGDYMMLLQDYLTRQKTNDALAIKQEDTELSYRQWYQQSTALAATLHHLAGKSNHIALVFPNSIAYAVSYFAVLYASRVIVPMGPEVMQEEFCHTLSYCEIDVVLSYAAWKEQLLSHLKDYPYRVSVLFVDTNETLEVNPALSPVPKTTEFSSLETADSVALMPHTSGSTSNPRRVMTTHRNLITNAQANINILGLTSQDKTLIVIPMRFGLSNTNQFLSCIMTGASMVILKPPFWVPNFIKTVQQESITYTVMVPSMLMLLLQFPIKNKKALETLKSISFSGSAMPAGRQKQLMERFPSLLFYYSYGLTEASTRVALLHPEYFEAKQGSVGLPIEGVHLRILSEEGKILPPGSTGEVLIQGPNIMKGYYKQPEATAETLIDGWFHSGDLGYLDEDGFLFLTGRKKNLIISGGQNISPEEVEEILNRFEQITDSCVFAKSDLIAGELPHALIVSPQTVNRKELARFCSQYLEEYKIPVTFEQVESIPKTYNGKIDRKRVDQLYRNEIR